MVALAGEWGLQFSGEREFRGFVSSSSVTRSFSSARGTHVLDQLANQPIPLSPGGWHLLREPCDLRGKVRLFISHEDDADGPPP
jgi:hypothetical protein